MLKFIFVLLALIGCSTTPKNNGKFQLRDYSIETLPNGMRILYVPDNKLPYLNLTLNIQSGAYSDEQGKSGSTQLMLSLLNKGTTKRSAQEISSEIEGMGADYGASADSDFLTINLEGLSFHEDKLLENFIDILFHSKLDAKEFQKLKTRSLAQIQQSFNQTSTLKDLAFQRYYFEENPYSESSTGSLRDVKKLKLADIKSRYDFHFQPEKAWLVVVGKYTPEFNQKLKQYFSLWKSKTKKEILTEKTVPEIKGKNILLVNKEDLNQAEITFGHKGILRTAPEYMTIQLANSIFGQGFSSRLIDRIRVQLGLTYSISSQFDMKQKAGVWTAETFTKSESVGQLVTEFYKTYDEFYSKGVTDAEVNIAKGAMSGKFPMLLETAEKTAFNLMYLRFFGIDDDYLRNYQINLSKITAEDVNAVIKKYFNPNNLKVVIVGNKNKIEPQLVGQGNLKVISYKEVMK